MFACTCNDSAVLTSPDEGFILAWYSFFRYILLSLFLSIIMSKFEEKNREAVSVRVGARCCVVWCGHHPFVAARACYGNVERANYCSGEKK